MLALWLMAIRVQILPRVHCTTCKEDPQFHPGSSGWIVPDGSAEIQLKSRTWNQGTVIHSVGSSFQFRASDGHEARWAVHYSDPQALWELGTISWLGTQYSQRKIKIKKQTAELSFKLPQPVRQDHHPRLTERFYFYPRQFYGNAMLHVPCPMIVPWALRVPELIPTKDKIKKQRPRQSFATTRMSTSRSSPLHNKPAILLCSIRFNIEELLSANSTEMLCYTFLAIV